MKILLFHAEVQIDSQMYLSFFPLFFFFSFHSYPRERAQLTATKTEVVVIQQVFQTKSSICNFSSIAWHCFLIVFFNFNFRFFLLQKSDPGGRFRQLVNHMYPKIELDKVSDLPK